MKKFVSRIVVMIICVVTALTAFVGCDWITTNVDADLKQVVATVKASDNVNSEDITKKQVTAGYLAYGYQYVQSYGYTTSQAYALVLSNLVNNRIIVQTAREELSKTYEAVKGKTTGLTAFEEYFKSNTLAGSAALDAKTSSAANLEKFLSEYEVKQAKYSVRKSIDSMIDSFVTDTTDDEEVTYEDVSYTARTTPTEEAAADLKLWELDDEEKAKPTEEEYLIANVVLGLSDADLKALRTKKALNEAVADKYEVDYTGKGRKKAYDSLIKSLRKSGLIAQDEKVNSESEWKYSYFEDLYKSQLESALITRYEESLVAGVESQLNGDGYKSLWNQYVEEYKYQRNSYLNSISDYETALDAASDTKFVLANPFTGTSSSENGYGYVLNLLIGFTDEQTEVYNTYKAKAGKTNQDISDFCAGLANQIIAKDQRSTWVQNSYGKYDDTNKSFAFDEKYLLTKESDYTGAAKDAYKKLASFVGDVAVKNAEGYKVKDDNEVETQKWNFTDVTSASLGFSDFYAQYVTTLTGLEEKHYEDGVTGIGMVANYSENSEKINNAFKDLMFAFSTDTGCLNKTYGYLSTPQNSSYVKEFADAARDVVKAGEGAYTIVTTDYGYHVILCTKKVWDEYVHIDGDGNMTSGFDKFVADIADENTLAYKYKKVKVDGVVDTEISKIASRLVSLAKEKDGTVSYNYSAFNDLVEKDDFDTLTQKD